MKITASKRYIDSKKKCQSFKGVPKTTRYLPEALGSVAKRVGLYVGAPEQKLLLATTALLAQPLIDLKFAEEDKKIDSAIKSASKAIAGGLTGVTIRALFIKWTKKSITMDPRNRSFLCRYFFPYNIVDLHKSRPEIAKIELKKFNETLGTIFAILFMILFSNSKVDVPITNDLQDLLGGVIKDKKSWLQSIGEVTQNREKIIKQWLEKRYNTLKNIANKGKRIIDIITEDKNKQKNQKEIK